MRTLPTLLLLALLTAAPGALASTRVIVYCDHLGTATCGVGVGDRVESCGTDFVSPCLYTTNGVGVGARYGPTLGLCDGKEYCLDANVGYDPSCVGNESVYEAGHNDVIEGGESRCVHRSNAACDSMKDIVLRILTDDHEIPVAGTCRTLIGYP